MTDTDIQQSAETLWAHWQQSRRMAELPARGRPSTRADGYAIQSRLAAVSGQQVVGWKIAATSPAGQAHINVDGPIAGRMLEKRVVSSGATFGLDGNLMRVAEAEFAFRLGRDLSPRDRPYDVDEVMGAVDALHLSLEVPDSRFHDFTIVGAAQLIADDACACWLALGPEVRADWRAQDLAAHIVHGHKNGTAVATGSGKNVLGDPRLAMTWIANEMREYGTGLRAGQFVTTGTCIVPIAVAPGDRVHMDFGVLGSIDAAFS